MQELKWFATFTKSSLDSVDMKVLEMNAEALGIEPIQLMENAGTAVANFINKKFPRTEKILVLCGKGNNGGDGLVAARHLAASHKITVAIIGSKKEITSLQALLNLHTIEKNPFIDLVEHAEEKIDSLLENCDLVVDAIFGTGFTGALPRQVEAVAKKVEKSKKQVVSIDLPSGLDATTGYEKGAFKATATITFHKLKTGLLNSKNAGTIVVADIGIPFEAEICTGPGDLFKAAPKRSKEGSKFDNGRVLIIAGSDDFHGAPFLAAEAAYNTLASLRIGAGYAVLFVPSEIRNLARRISPNLIVRPFGKETIAQGDMETAKQEIEKSNSIAIGMGIGRENATLEAAAEIIKYAQYLNKKIVVDADAIYALDRIGVLNKNVIVTPQEKEFEQIYGEKPSTELGERARQAVAVSNKLNACVVLKGHTSIITDGRLLKLNFAETPALATMGTGDVLSGIIAGYAATGASAFDASAAGVYLHSQIGDSLAAEKGMHIIATDLIDEIPHILKNYDSVLK
ncbi:MAG: NAD(P)H-hydrate dehydratase [Candidatus Micrarchaeia archaeon]